MFDNLRHVFEQASAIQEQIANAHKQFALERVHGESGAGLVRIEFNGDGKAKQIHIDDSIMDDKDVLAELIVAAINDAVTQIEHKKRTYFKKVAEQNNIPTGMFPF